MEDVESLTRFGAMANRHWHEHRPRLYQHLKARGQLQKALLHAQESAKSLIGELVSRQGQSLESAREQALSRFVLLPAESEQPLLEPDRMPFDQPEPTIRSRPPTA